MREREINKGIQGRERGRRKTDLKAKSVKECEQKKTSQENVVTKEHP